jgi:periplasmic protein TonB
MIGAVFAVVLFVAMALVQKLGDVAVEEKTLDETVMAYTPPEIQELEDEPPPPEEEEPPPELEVEPPQLSLDQLDIALNPGTGGALTGDFAMPSVATSASDLGTEDFVDFSNLDQVPRPIGVSGFNFPRRLLRKKVSGKVVLLVKLNAAGEVLEARVDSSTLPEFDDFVAGEVRRWRFTPPTVQGRPVKAMARLPIPIQIN